jgi:hypothetical protein
MEGKSGKNLQEALAARSRQYEDMADWGGENDPGARILRGKARELKPMEYLGMAYAAAGSKEKREEIMARYTAGGGTDVTGFIARGARRYENLGEEASKALQDQVSAQTVSQMVGYVESKQGEAEVGTGLSGAQKLGKFLGLSDLGSFWGDAESMASALEGAGGAAKLGQQEQFRGVAGVLKKLQGAGKGTDARSQLLAQLESEMGAIGDFGPGATTESLTEATGEQAEQNSRSADALEKLAGQLEEVGFTDFVEGSKDFLEGAKQLRLAMESETIKQALTSAKGP